MEDTPLLLAPHVALKDAGPRPRERLLPQVGPEDMPANLAACVFFWPTRRAVVAPAIGTKLNSETRR